MITDRVSARGSGRREVLLAGAEKFGTPCYVYFADRIRKRIDTVRDALGGRFGISYAVKSNPNMGLIDRIRDRCVTLDVSSIGEVERCLAIGASASDLTFSGPAKREEELARAVEVGVGEMVCESVQEAFLLDRLAGEAGKVMNVLIRINPKRSPKQFGVNMSGKPSQFGVDEEEMPRAIEAILGMRHLRLIGFHIYSGTNSLSVEAISENFSIFIDLFSRFSEMYELVPEKLVFGSGFGVPYHDGDDPLDLPALARRLNDQIDAMKQNPRLARAALALEMGRYLIAPEGFLLTRVIRNKSSRGTTICLCDAGFNNHLAACGMMGTIIRRNWPIENVSSTDAASSKEYTLVGPLCTTIDILASDIELPETNDGDLLAIGSSGAYGHTASPARFISHPEPREILAIEHGGSVEFVDVSESPRTPDYASVISRD